MKKSPTLKPHLIVKDAARAIEFYVTVFGAKELSRHVDPNLNGAVVHAELAIGDSIFSIAEEHHDWHNHSPRSLGGSPTPLTLYVDDAKAVGQRMERAGARVIFPIEDQFYGERAGRLEDPFGHLWIITQPLVELSHEEIQGRINAMSKPYKDK